MAYTTIDKPTDYFNTVLFNGNGSTQSITGVGFQPDFVWGKARSGTDAVYNHQVFDVIRGATKHLRPNNNTAEGTLTNSLTSFDSDGFSLGNDGHMNLSGNANVAWNWLAGGSASSNTDGSITSNVSANTTSGFSIVSYTGTGSATTVGHGLGSAPSMIIVKNRDSGTDIWTVYHVGTDASIPQNKFMQLDDTSAVTDSTLPWNDTAPTSSVFTIGTYSSTNGSSQNMIAYCFAEKKGYSKFGSYTGNGDSSGNGPFIYTGFKPAWIMIKNASTGSSYWLMVDNKRDTFNVTTKKLYANINNGEFDDTHYNFDFLSNGFKLKSTSTTTNYNNSGDTYIYMSFAESPFVTGASGIPTTAR